VLTLRPQQETGYAPLEQGQVIEINPNCMKANFGFRFVRGIASGFIAMVLFSSLIFDILIGDLMTEYSLFFGFLDDMLIFKYWVVSIVALEMYLWPSAPPMIFDRVNRRVIFQVFFRTKVIAWDDCVASIQHFVQASTASASQGYNLRIEGNVINAKPGSKPQRAAAMIHQSGISDDLLNYWEYIRHYMEGGPNVVPKPLKLQERNSLAAAWFTFKHNYPGLTIAKTSWQDSTTPKRPLSKKFVDLFFLITVPPVVLISIPLVMPLFTVSFLAAKTGRVRSYSNEIIQLCKEGQALAKAQAQQTAQRKPVIRVNGKLMDSE
jgi:hypothetical protein